MATSGSITGSFSGGSGSSHYSFIVNWERVAVNVANRTSTINIYWYMQRDGSDWGAWKNVTPWTQTCGDASTSGDTTVDMRGTPVNTNVLVRSTQVIIQHDASGVAGSVGLSGTLDVSGTTAGTGSFNGTMAIDNIAVTPPSVTAFNVTDGVSLPSGFSGTFVATKSKFKFTVTATATNATIANYSFYYLLNSSYILVGNSTASPYTSPNFAPAGTFKFKVVVTDSNGLSTTVWYKSSSAVSTTESGGTSITVYPYESPTLTTETNRCNSSGTLTESGTYARVKLTYSISSCNGKNSAIVHKVTVNSTDTTLTSGTAATVGAGALNVNNSYSVVYTVTDAFTTVTKTDTIAPQTIHRAYHPSGGVAFGTSAESGKLKTTYNIVLVKGSYTNTIQSASLGANRTITLPNATGTVTLGTGTNGYLVKWNGTNSVTNGPQLGSDTTKFLRNDGTWQVPPGKAPYVWGPVTFKVGEPAYLYHIGYNDSYYGGLVMGLGQGTGFCIRMFMVQDGSLTTWNLWGGYSISIDPVSPGGIMLSNSWDGYSWATVYAG